MRAALSRVSLLGLVALLALAGSGIVPQAVQAQDEAALFAQAIAGRAAGAAGPMSGDLIQANGFNTTTGAGVALADFSTSVTFVNPPEPNAPPWDLGISFRRNGDEVQQIVVDSVGFWYDSPFPAGTEDSGAVATFNTTPGASNTFDLVVEGERALFGVNGDFVAGFDLPPGVAADVEIGTGYFVGSVVDGRPIAYRDFEVWPVAGAQTVAPTAQPAATAAVAETPPATTTELPATASTPAVATADEALFAEVLASQAGVAPLAGPHTANLRETTGLVPVAWADVSVFDFHASATIEVPESTSAVAWNIGFMFASTPSGTLRLVVDAQGQVFFSAGAGAPSVVGQAGALRTSPGESNTIDLLAAGGRALFGVNGELAAAVDLPLDAGAADVGIGSAFYSDQIESDRLTAFENFVVLPLAATALGGTGTAAGPGGVTAEQSAAFAARLEELAAVEPIAGPFAGRLVEATAGSVPLAPAGVSLADFGVEATFMNPVNPTDALWDAGFRFRDDGTTNNRIVVDSLGDVYVLLAGQETRKAGSVASYDADSGGSNTLQLVVAGDEAMFGVNGELVAVLELTAAPVTSDVQVGTGFFSEDFVVGRVTDYQDFRVWELT